MTSSQMLSSAQKNIDGMFAAGHSNPAVEKMLFRDQTMYQQQGVSEHTQVYKVPEAESSWVASPEVPSWTDQASFTSQEEEVSERNAPTSSNASVQFQSEGSSDAGKLSSSGRTGASRRQRRRNQIRLKAENNRMTQQLDLVNPTPQLMTTYQMEQQCQFQYHQAVIPWQPCLNVQTMQGDMVLFMAPAVPVIAVAGQCVATNVTAGVVHGSTFAPAVDVETTNQFNVEEESETSSDVGGKFEQSLKDLSTRCPSIATEGSDNRDGPCMLFPPTPDFTPLNSPRLSAATATGSHCSFDFLMPTDNQQAECPSPAECEQGSHCSFDFLMPTDTQQADRPSPAQCNQVLGNMSSNHELQRQSTQWALQNAGTLMNTPHGSRVVQDAMKEATVDELRSLLSIVKGRVHEVIASPHAHHVLRSFLDLLPAEDMQFVVEELQGSTVAMSRHRFGCRVLERLFQRLPTEKTKDIMEEVVEQAADLSRHTYGNFVMQSVLANGTEEQKVKIVEILANDIQRLSRHRVSSHVIRFALTISKKESQRRLVDVLKADQAEFADLSHHHCGSFVVRQVRRTLEQL